MNQRHNRRPVRTRQLLVAGVAAATIAVTGAALAVGGSHPAAAATLGGTATVTSAATGAALTSGGSATPFTLTLPAAAVCSGDTQNDGYHEFTYLVPTTTAVTGVTFLDGVPSAGYGFYTSADTYAGPINTAPTTGQVVGIPLDLDWSAPLAAGNLTVADLAGGGAKAWDGGVACANASGVVSDYWQVELTFTASTSDPEGLVWSIGAPVVSAPTVTKVSPTDGPTKGGTTVTVTGTNLTGATAVKFGTTKGTKVTVDSSTKLTVDAPAHAKGLVNVTVTTAGGTSATSTKDRYTYVAAPTVTKVSPTDGPTKGGTTVTVTGTNLTGATAVKFGTAKGTKVKVDSSTKLTVDAPAHAKGLVNVTVTTAGGTSATSTKDRYTYVAAPTVTKVSPTDGPAKGGTTVTVTGTNLTGATAVKFGTAKGTKVKVDSSTKLTVDAPAHAKGLVNVTVTTAGGTSATSTKDRYTY